MALRIFWRGFDVIQKGLNEFDEKVQREVSRLAIGKAARVVVRQVRANARAIKRTGTLAKSIGVKIWTHKRKYKKKQVLALVGARRGFKQTDEYGNIHVPAKTGHLPERGFYHAKGKKQIAGKRWLERGVESTASEYERVLGNEMEAQFGRALERTTKRFQRQVRRI